MYQHCLSVIEQDLYQRFFHFAGRRFRPCETTGGQQQQLYPVEKLKVFLFVEHVWGVNDEWECFGVVAQ